MLIRPATHDDLPGILEVYNDVVTSSTAVYSRDPSDLAERTRWFEARVALGYPVLVAESEGRIAGFSSFGDFRPWWGFRHTVEHSVYVADGFQGQGVGRRLVEALFAPAEALGKHVMIAGIDASNVGSVRFHEKLGFETVGHLREVGHKFGHWLDLVFMQRFVDAPGAERED
ncbi:GNAT family N-acetyltransferase [Kordiimonas marina]|uniref:GNAT family N-acetyltransferase n=1 Tax=Kordiimonas marina TaxID=2872312 RepID=UPI001FF1B7C0|nr:GNAT family N-acetyltransferase [Kordiimonas marina]MCJ9430537.1 GNAT family N-acetyltransferase [Kordiimonas marina]